jgi:hypothetical protein
VSEFRDAIQDIVADRECGTGEVCRNLVTGATFFAEVQEIEDVELNTELGRDARERLLMYVRDRAQAAAIRLGQGIEISLYAVLTKFTVVRRKDNPATPQVEFGLMKFVPEVDT